jgi:hypothetical protein
MRAMRYFLLVYDRDRGQIIEEAEFDESERAVALRARFDREVRYHLEPQVEVVVLGAQSRESLVSTHGRYFKDANELLTS